MFCWHCWGSPWLWIFPAVCIVMMIVCFVRMFRWCGPRADRDDYRRGRWSRGCCNGSYGPAEPRDKGD